MMIAARRPALFFVLLPLAALLLLAGACTPSTPAPPRVAAWVGEQSGLLFMRVISEEVLRDARLTAPGGDTILTRRLSTPEPSGGYSDGGLGRPSVGVGVGAGSSGSFGTGIGLSFPVMGGGGARSAGLSSQAEFSLTPEQLASYRARPQDWQLELRFDDRIASMPAPALMP